MSTAGGRGSLLVLIKQIDNLPTLLQCRGLHALSCLGTSVSLGVTVSATITSQTQNLIFISANSQFNMIVDNNASIVKDLTILDTEVEHKPRTNCHFIINQ